MSGPNLSILRQLLIKSHPIVSEAVLKSKKRAIPGILVSSVYDMMSEISLRSKRFWAVREQRITGR